MTPSKIEQNVQTAFQHQQAGRLDDAEKLYRQVLSQQPTHVDALCLLATITGQRGRLAEAVDLIRQAIRIKPTHPEAHYNLGVGLQASGQIEEAIAAYRQAVRVKPDNARALYNLGLALQHLGRLEEAAAAYRQVMRYKPDDVKSHYNLGLAFQRMGRLEEAMTAYHQTIRLAPDFPDAHNNLGIALKRLGRFDEAIQCFRQAIRLRPDYADALTNLGSTLHNTGKPDEAVAAHQQAIRFKPELSEAHYNLGNALLDTGRIDESISAYRQAVAVKPDDAAAHANLLLALNYQPAFDPRGLLAESLRWNLQHAEPLKRYIQPHANDRSPERQLRIGYVSADLCDHAISRFLTPLLAAHDHAEFEVFAYSQALIADKITAILKTHCKGWRSIVGLSDERTAQTIRDDQIDILVDLSGHTGNSRLLVFAHKPAPVQVTWLGYPGTTGLSTMDYRFTDALSDPPGRTDRFCCEKLIRLPHTNWCFEPPAEATPVNELPAIANHHITFGSFNNFAKVNEPTLKLWAKILLAVPGSRLLLKAKPLGCASVQQRVQQIMSAAGIEPDRLELIGWAPSATYLSPYHRVDIGLDTFPYHGTTTTCEAFCMGVPAVTLAGESHVSRVGVSLLTNVGLSELIAPAPEQYVRIAADLAGDLPKLADLRRTMRARMQASPLMDGPAFARDVEAAYRQIWRNWCESSV